MSQIVKYQHHSINRFELSGHDILLPLINVDEFEFDSIICYVKMKVFGTLGSFAILRFTIKKEDDNYQLVNSFDIIYKNTINDYQHQPVINQDGFTIEIIGSTEEDFYARAKIHCIS